MKVCAEPERADTRPQGARPAETAPSVRGGQCGPGNSRPPKCRRGAGAWSGGDGGAGGTLVRIKNQGDASRGAISEELPLAGEFVLGPAPSGVVSGSASGKVLQERLRGGSTGPRSHSSALQAEACGFIPHAARVSRASGDAGAIRCGPFLGAEAVDLFLRTVAQIHG